MPLHSRWRQDGGRDATPIPGGSYKVPMFSAHTMISLTLISCLLRNHIIQPLPASIDHRAPPRKYNQDPA